MEKEELFMEYCKKCGAELEEGAAFCPKCGAAQNETQQPDPENVQQTPPSTSGADWVQQNSYQSQPPVNDSGSIGWGVLGFCIPIVGLILFLVWKDQKPRTAKVAGIGALIAVIISVIWYALVILVGLGSVMMY